MENNIFERSIGLLGESEFGKIQNKQICILGLGGVGGTVFESLLRTGFRKFVIVDFDVVSPSNLNRQILYSFDDINVEKVAAAAKHALSINHQISISAKNEKITYDNVGRLIDNSDFVIDCIDDRDGKIAIVSFCEANKIPYICSMGMANKVDPTKVSITKLNKTTNDPLARKFRYELKQKGIDLSHINCVASSEQPLMNGNTLSSLITVTSVAGLLISSYVINYFKEI